MHTVARTNDEPVSHDDLVSKMDAAHTRASAAQRELFLLILQAEGRDELWQQGGARDLAHWLCMRYSISTWKAHRWIAAAHALEELPRIDRAFETGQLGVDKVVELTRFATASTEDRLVRWAKTVSGARIRRRAELETRDSVSVDQDARKARTLSMWYVGEHRVFRLEAQLPAADGAVVAQAIRRQAEQVPSDPDALSPESSRLADGLVRVCSGAIAADPDPDRATVVVHVQARALGEVSSGNPKGATKARTGQDPSGPTPIRANGTEPGLPAVIAAEITSAEIDRGPVIHPVVAARLTCDARIQVVVENLRGEALAMGRTSRVPSAAMMRQLRHRDRECTFPNCGATRFLVAHHLVFWSRGGPTDLESMALDCSLHHGFVHERGWSQRRDPDGRIQWFRPDGSLYVPGPAPPPVPVPEPLEMVWDQAESDEPRLPSRMGRGP
jgi:uncharacterized protein DUF222